MATPLIQASMDGKQTEVERLIAEGGAFLFCFFFFRASLSLVPQLCITLGADLNAKTPGGMTALVIRESTDEPGRISLFLFSLCSTGPWCADISES
jgi:hypothetical protein